MVNKLHVAIGLLLAIMAFIGLYIYFSYAPMPAQQNNATIENVEINKTETTGIKLIGAYWGNKTNPADSNETCSNDTKNLADGFKFTVEAETGIDSPNYDTCYIVNNGHKQQTTTIEMHDNYMNVQTKADTDRTNYVAVCCELGERMDCSDAVKLMQCP